MSNKPSHLLPSCLLKCGVILAVILLAASHCGAQGKPAAPTHPAAPSAPADQTQWIEELQKNPNLVAELGKLGGRLQHEVSFPPARKESKLLPLLPESTTFYLALSNYGDAMHQAVSIFGQELQNNAELHDWWQRGQLGKSEPLIEAGVEEVYQLSQYFGDEIVIAGGTQGKRPRIVMLAETRKPGLKEMLAPMLAMVGGKSGSGVVLLGPEDLATVQAESAQKGVVLVRPDFVVIGDLGTVRSLNAAIEKHTGSFASAPFGQRVKQAYDGGATLVAAADVHDLVARFPLGSSQNEEAFQRTGFGDMKYWVWRRRVAGDQTISEAELSFEGARHGVPSWLAAQGQMESLDFVSPDAILVGSALLTNPASIFDGAKEIASATGSQPFAGLSSFEQTFNVNLRDDVLARLAGEMTVEFDNFAQPNPAMNVILRVKDVDGLQKTVNKMLAATKRQAEQFEDRGTTYYTVHIAAPQTTFDVTYAFVDGYLVIGSSRETVTAAVRVHKDGSSLEKSQKFAAALPPGHSGALSALFYEDPVAVGSQQLQRVAPNMTTSFAKILGPQKPTVVGVYADETAIREESTSGMFDAGAVLMGAAIAIPNLMRSRTAANEATAVGSLRTVITAEITYAATYPQRGFARDLATLGPDPVRTNAVTADHASFIDSTLGGSTCAGGAWCTKNGFRFRLTAECSNSPCKEFVAVATPVNRETGDKSFCSTSDGVIRFNTIQSVPANAAQCRAWPPVDQASPNSRGAAPAQTKTTAMK